MSEKLKKTTEKAEEKAKELCEFCKAISPFLAIFAASAIVSGVICTYEIKKHSDEAYIDGFKDGDKFAWELAKSIGGRTK